MKIRHVSVPLVGQEIENTFVAFDDVESELGTADVVQALRDALCPSRPHHLQIRTNCEDAALFALLGAATARAMLLARLRPGTPARIFTEVDPDDAPRMEVLLSQGYKDDDGLMRMAKEVRRGPLVKPMPRGCVNVKDYLIDEKESKYFIERYNAMFASDVDDEWLKGLKQKPNFCRLLLAAPDGLAGEMLTWSDCGCGVVGVILTPPHWQRKGVGSHLLDQARQYWADKGLTAAYFDVWTRLSGAMRLAATCGFRPERALKRYPGIDVD